MVTKTRDQHSISCDRRDVFWPLQGAHIGDGDALPPPPAVTPLGDSVQAKLAEMTTGGVCSEADMANPSVLSQVNAVLLPERL